MATPSIVFDSTTDWQQFTGQSLITAGVIRLSHRNTASDLGLTAGLICNYRFGQSQSYHSSAGTNNNATVETLGTGGIQLIDKGATQLTGVFDDNDFGAIRLGGGVDNYTWYNTDSGQTGGPIFVSTISTWLDYNFGSNGTVNLFGIDHQWIGNVTSANQYDPIQNATQYLQFSTYGGSNGQISLYISSYQYSGPVASWNADEIGTDDGNMHHVAVYLFWYLDTSLNVQLVPHLFLDGKWCANTGYLGQGATWQPAGPQGSKAPVLFTKSDSTHPDYQANSTPGAYQTETWGVYALDTSNPHPGIIDEFSWSRTDLVLDNTNQRITAIGLGGQTPYFTDRQFVLTNLRRHTDPELVGTENTAFVMVGPVIQTPGTAGIVQFNATIIDGVTNTDTGFSRCVQASTRASATAFAATDTSLPWSNWYDLTNGRLVSVGTQGSGPYSQVQLRIFPSNDPLCVTSPGVDRLEVYTAATVSQDANVDLPATLHIINRVDIPCDMYVTSTGDIYLDATLRVPSAVQTTYFDASLWVAMESYFDATINVHANGDSYFDATINVPDHSGDLYFPATMATTSNDVYLGALLTVHIPAVDADLPATINVPIDYFLATMHVSQTGLSYLGATMNIPLALPNPVVNLQATAAANTWETQANVMWFWQPPVPSSSAVVGYYYNLNSSPNPVATSDWAFTTDQHFTTTLNQSGKWYFAVAALDTVGGIGPAETYVVWYNHPPTAPGTLLMQIDGQDTIIGQPLVSHSPPGGHTLSWSAATDADPNDQSNLTYEIQIASQSDFGIVTATGLPSIAQDIPNLTGLSYIWTNITNPGTWFWRICANDGKQSGAWSQTGSFAVNAPPNRPTNLACKATT